MEILIKLKVPLYLKDLLLEILGKTEFLAEVKIMRELGKAT